MIVRLLLVSGTFIYHHYKNKAEEEEWKGSERSLFTEMKYETEILTLTWLKFVDIFHSRDSQTEIFSKWIISHSGEIFREDLFAEPKQLLNFLFTIFRLSHEIVGLIDQNFCFCFFLQIPNSPPLFLR